MSYRKNNQFGTKLGEKDIDDIKPVIEFATMSSEMKELCITKAKDAMRAIGDSNLNYFKKIAKKIKNDLEAEKNENWNVIVGTEYGAYMAFEKAYLVYFRLNELYFLIFRFGA
jgi:surfactin synthase thioesterase subunit